MSETGKTNDKILVAMSGGVDSSATAVLMKEAGFDVMGANMRLFDPETDDEGCKSCCSLKDAMDASSVAQKLDIDFEYIDMRKEFRDNVINKFIDEYENGLTPNPCIDCNRYMKFERLWAFAVKHGCRGMATGHYARIDRTNPDKPVLRKAINRDKDQTYVLYRMPKELLASMYFPLGEIASKEETRQIAKDAGLSNFRKSESQDICFVPDGDYAEVIRKYRSVDYPSGEFVDEEGNLLGTHRGMIHYTIGQRRGLGISALPEPYYVKQKDVEKNRITVTPNDRLFESELKATDINWLTWDELPDDFRCSAKIRYRHTEQPCTVKINGNDIMVKFDEPQRAITPGQSVVLYVGDIVIGGGTII